VTGERVVVAVSFLPIIVGVHIPAYHEADFRNFGMTRGTIARPHNCAGEPSHPFVDGPAPYPTGHMRLDPRDPRLGEYLTLRYTRSTD
jgi:hypothetical protein